MLYIPLFYFFMLSGSVVGCLWCWMLVILLIVFGLGNWLWLNFGWCCTYRWVLLGVPLFSSIYCLLSDCWGSFGLAHDSGSLALAVGLFLIGAAGFWALFFSSPVFFFNGFSVVSLLACCYYLEHSVVGFSSTGLMTVCFPICFCCVSVVMEGGVSACRCIYLGYFPRLLSAYRVVYEVRVLEDICVGVVAAAPSWWFWFCSAATFLVGLVCGGVALLGL